MFFRLVKELAEKEGISEVLKADNQMLLGAADERSTGNGYGNRQ